MSVISDNIRRLREREGIEQLELAERLGISNKTISSWECGRTEPRMGMIERIVDALGCTKADIIEPETVTYMFKETPYTKRMLAYFEKINQLSPKAREAIFDQIDYQLHKEGKDEG